MMYLIEMFINLMKRVIGTLYKFNCKLIKYKIMKTLIISVQKKIFKRIK